MTLSPRLLFGVFVCITLSGHATQATLAPVTGIELLRAGEGAYVLALRQDGVLLGWGNNTIGTLGNGTTNPNLTPSQIAVPGGAADIVALAPGFVFTLALKADGTVLGWGTNGLGQLGDGTFTSRLTPVQTSGFGSGSGVIAIATGLSHSVAVKSDSSVWTWGSNNNSNLGNPSIVGPSNVPVSVTSLGPGSGVIAVAAGGNFTLALKADGTVWGWGNNANGQLGIGSFAVQPTPVQVKSPDATGFLTGIIALSAPPSGPFALALKSDGTVWAWGLNTNGQLGNGTTMTSNLPVQVQGLTQIVAIDAAGAAGNQHSLALRSDGAVFAWGSNANGQLGTGNNTPSAVPVTVAGVAAGSGVVDVSGANGFSLARKADGSVLAWGDNSSGQLGDNTFFGSPSPVTVVGLSAGSGVRTVFSGIAANHSLAVRQDGTLLAWGSNSAGQLGIGTTVTQRTPVAVSGLTDVVAAAAGANHSVALRADGSVWAWGDNSNGQLGIGSTQSQLTPVQVRTSTTTFLASAIAVIAANNTSFAVTSGGEVWAWGSNVTGQLGTNLPGNQSYAVQVHGVGDVGFLSGVTAIAACTGTAYALTLDGGVLAWGQNAAGQVGDGTQAQRPTPVQVAGLSPGSGVVAITAIAGGAAALKSDGSVVAWGLNGSGQVGDGTTSPRSSPTPTSGLGAGSAVTAMAGGGAIGDGHSFAVKADSTLWSWGGNGSGQLGDGTLFQRSAPAQILTLTAGVTSAAAGMAHSIALLADESVLTWGANGTGQLGDGTIYTRNLTPASVLIDDVTAPAVSLSASRTVLRPPNGNMVPVTFSGRMTDVDTGIDTVTAGFMVTDEYGRIQPAGAIALDAHGNYSFTLQLEAQRNEDDKNGRQYTVQVSARDRAGNVGFAEVVVAVPHDRR